MIDVSRRRNPDLPAAAERAAASVQRLREAGGAVRAYRWQPEVVAALDELRATAGERTETALIARLILDAARRVRRKH